METEEEIQRIRERLHALGDFINTLNMEIAVLKKSDAQIQGLAATIKSLTETISANNVVILQQLTAQKGWQEAHEKLDEERWDGVREKLSELKGMLESIPVKLAEDLSELRAADLSLSTAAETNRDAADTRLWKVVNKNSEAITLLKGAWLAVSIGLPALAAIYEFFKSKGGHP